MINLNQIYAGNALDVLKSWPDAFIDCVITSPPYWGLRAYGTNPQIWDGDPKCQHEWNAIVKPASSGGGEGSTVGGGNTNQKMSGTKLNHTSNFCGRCNAWRGELGLEPTFDLYISHLCQIFDEVKRVLKPTGTVWVNLGDSYSGSGGAGGDYNPGGLREGQPKFKQGKADVPAKSLCCIPDRFKVAMLDSDSDDVYELNKDLTSSQRYDIIKEIQQYNEGVK